MGMAAELARKCMRARTAAPASGREDAPQSLIVLLVPAR